MKAKRYISFLLCLCLFFGTIPAQAYAAAVEETTQASVPENLEYTNSIGEIGGYLIGNSITTSRLFEEYNFSWPTGFGFAAEQGNNLIDKFKGLNATVVGGDNAANGPDRMIINRDGSIT